MEGRRQGRTVRGSAPVGGVLGLQDVPRPRARVSFATVPALRVMEINVSRAAEHLGFRHIACRFRNTGTKYVSESGIKWMGGSTKRQCDRALVCPNRGARPPPQVGQPDVYCGPDGRRVGGKTVELGDVQLMAGKVTSYGPL